MTPENTTKQVWDTAVSDIVDKALEAAISNRGEYRVFPFDLATRIAGRKYIEDATKDSHWQFRQECHKEYTEIFRAPNPEDLHP